MVIAPGERLPPIKEYLRGPNPRIASAAEMIKTFTDADLGGACCHSRTGTVELCLNHLALRHVHPLRHHVPRGRPEGRRQQGAGPGRFRLKNAQSWGNGRTGADLAAQIDPSFVLGESAVADTTVRSGRTA